MPDSVWKAERGAHIGTIPDSLQPRFRHYSRKWHELIRNRHVYPAWNAGRIYETYSTCVENPTTCGKELFPDRERILKYHFRGNKIPQISAWMTLQTTNGSQAADLYLQLKERVAYTYGKQALKIRNNPIELRLWYRVPSIKEVRTHRRPIPVNTKDWWTTRRLGDRIITIRERLQFDPIQHCERTSSYPGQYKERSRKRQLYERNQGKIVDWWTSSRGFLNMQPGVIISERVVVPATLQKKITQNTLAPPEWKVLCVHMCTGETWTRILKKRWKHAGDVH